MADITIALNTTEALAQIDVLQAKAEQLKATLTECKGLCEGCKIQADFTLRGSDLVAAARIHDYRTLK